MRTIPFKDVFDRVVRLHGRDPRKLDNSDLANAVCDHINYRVRTICQAWLWPEWVVTEERAFRQVWNSTSQYKKVSDTDGFPDEVFYLGSAFSAGGDFGSGYGYYRVKSDAVTDPPVGTVPTNTTYWEPIDVVDSFIAYDQPCRRAIGMVLGVFGQNPRVPTGSTNGRRRFTPSEKGIDVIGGGTTVFITQKMPVPTYTMTPYVVGKTYARGQVVFYPSTNECYQAFISTSAVPTDTTKWNRVPFLDAWTGYVCNGAFADSLMEFNQGGNGDIQAKMVMAQAANERADTQLQLEVDALAVQGQKLRYNFCDCNYWMESMLSPGSVTTLTEACQADTGWAYPSPPPVDQGFFYYPWVMSLKTDTPTLIASIPTANLSTGTIAKIYTAAEYRLDAGPSDPVGDPGQGDPSDYNLATNNKHWVQVI